MNNGHIEEILPNTFTVISEPTIISVYTRGTLDGAPKDVMKRYIPENSIDDIVRSFIAKSKLSEEYFYRENVFLQPAIRQRPIVIKYLIQHKDGNNFPIYVIRTKGDISRKLREIRYHLSEIIGGGFPLTSLIVLINKSLISQITYLKFPMHAFICSFDYRL